MPQKIGTCAIIFVLKICIVGGLKMKNVAKFIKNSIKMEIAETRDGFPLGQSKIGGKPHLPRGG